MKSATRYNFFMKVRKIYIIKMILSLIRSGVVKESYRFAGSSRTTKCQQRFFRCPAFLTYLLFSLYFALPTTLLNAFFK